MSDPFKISGPAQMGVSGGRTSGYMLWRTLDANEGVPDGLHLTFQNTGKEDPATLAFVHEMGVRWGVQITWMEYCREYMSDGPRYKLVDFASASRNSEPFDAFLLYYDEYRCIEKDEPPILPNVVNRMCSDRMKIKAAEWYMRSLGYEEWDAYLGIRKDEPQRYHRAITANTAGSNRWETVMPLYTAGVTKADVEQFWAAQPFDLELNSDFGNCDLCFMKHEDKRIRIIQDKPEAALWWIAQEERTGQLFCKNRPTYRQLAWDAKQLKQHPNMDIEESIDCFCGD